jgi:soluble lytic murein transglycosylase-like protein
VAAAAVFVAGQPDVRHRIELTTLEWLQGRHEARALSVDGNRAQWAGRAGGREPRHRRRSCAAAAPAGRRGQWIAPLQGRPGAEPAWCRKRGRWVSARQLDPTLILAVMAVESSFNPFAQSPVGAQGLMQVLTRVHDDKYEAFGGNHAAFDPVSNLRVGVQVLKDCIARAGSLHDGLRTTSVRRTSKRRRLRGRC